MKDLNRPATGLISRRRLLEQAAGGAALVSAMQSIGSGVAQIVEQPSPRRRQDFDLGWKFLKGDAPAAQQPGFPDSAWRDVDLPHDWSIEGPFSEKEPAQGSLPTGIGWYRKRFPSPYLKDRVFTVEFDGVYQNSEVWINGHYLGKRPYGYVPFAYDLTPHLLDGRDNVIAVKVDNSQQPNCRWYSGSGIYRHTWLLNTNALHVAYWGTFVATPRVSKETATMQVKTRVRNDGKTALPCTLTTQLVDKQEKVVATTATDHQLAPGEEYEFLQQLTIEKPNLWSPSDPYLYRMRSWVLRAKTLVDWCDTPCGIREAVFDADKGFLLNGERVKLNGVCLHHEAGCMGAAVPERVWERRLEILREMGCNAIRTSHNPYSAEFMDLCDRMGFLVMAEAFDEWKVGKGQIGPYGYANYFDEWHERDVKNFVHRDRNHPSIVLWSAGNEIGDQSDPKGAETLRMLLDIFHAEDPTRLVTAGCDRIASEPASNTARPEFLALLDVVGYNYVDRWRDRIEKYYSLDRAAFPQRRFIGTESGSMGGVRGDYRSLFPSEAPAGAPARGGAFRGGRGRAIDVEQLWKFVRTYDYVAGDFMWTGIDYLGESRWPGKGSAAGVIDTCGFKKDGFYFYQSQWTEKPMLHLFPHWNWKGREGQFIPVTCYTNCDTVELFLNGKSVGLKGYAFPRLGMEGRYGNYPARARVPRTTADLHLEWDVPYEPGTLKAVGMKDGKVAVTTEISTTGDPSSLVLSADRSKISADRRDVAHIAVQICDAQGFVVPVADHEVTFEVAGEGKLIGLDNGDPQSHEDYRSNPRKAFNGLCLAIVQASAYPGEIRVTANSPGLRPAAITISTIVDASLRRAV
ncbi:MAG TPA: glycoside hydrolase family 2 TIM barrel-domain containing protein [Bryobacteraceae bacterium]|nr:glycoside hydrolase family 2 TIM barrel-domain containing protein [Bryobacteraceae bacterium]